MRFKDEAPKQIEYLSADRHHHGDPLVPLPSKAHTISLVLDPFYSVAAFTADMIKTGQYDILTPSQT
ncbi:hypothetical protein JCM24511_07326 [Saitozyma sp. JCM 24511]|nr:hypothetical protein JCM24511_07326 [Saitozyma sp. JCM 24511]